jgi:hypothetical protein
MTTHKDAKTMAKSLRGALADRKISLSHSECLEIVARQFGFADWNTCAVKLLPEDKQPAPSRPGDIAPAASPQSAPTSDAATDASSEPPPTAAVWSACSFCGKKRNEVRTLMGGCGGWEGFRARRGQPERSTVFICDECVAMAAQINGSNGIAAAPVPQ